MSEEYWKEKTEYWRTLLDQKDARIAELEKALSEAKISHHHCEGDGFYSCPLSKEGCTDTSWPENECNCGAESHNAKIDAALSRSL